jgi:uncharacterized repeat protein (TIGR02543 family)
VKRLLLSFSLVLMALAVPGLAAARPAAVTWCGTDETAQNRVPDLAVSSREQVRFMYAIPSDGTDNFLATASGIASDAAWIDQWWQTQDPTRTPRFDRYPFPNCTNPFGQLDIGFIRLPNSTAYYSSSSTASFRLDADLRAQFPTTEKTIVYYDAPISDPRACGVTDYLSERTGGDQGMVYVFPRSCGLSPVGSGASSEVAAHELLHNLGAVPSGAPHECADSQAHACDSDADILAEFLRPGSTLDTVLLDVNHDDYYGHTIASLWDVQDSSWLAHLPLFPFSLGVAGSGTLSATVGETTLACDSGCTGLTLENGTAVSVTAVPARGFTFAGWSGACGGDSPACTFSIGGPTDATATFARTQVRLTVAVAGKGRVTSSPSGIACPRACRAAIVATRVTLAAKPAAGWKLKSWRGACTGRAARCTLDASGSARAVFVKK